MIKSDDEYLILAEKRIPEFKARTPHNIKTLLLFTGEQIKDLTLEHPLIQNKAIPIVIHNEVKSTFGTGVNVVVPGHDLDSLKIAAHYGLDKSGILTIKG